MLSKTSVVIDDFNIYRKLRILDLLDNVFGNTQLRMWFLKDFLVIFDMR